MGLLDRSKRKKLEVAESRVNQCINNETQQHLVATPDFFFPVFHSFAEELALDKIAVLFKLDNHYHLLLNHGFDYQTVLLNTFAPDFWLTLSDSITPNQWYTYEFKDLEPFDVLFSGEERKMLNAIHLKFCIVESQQWIVLIADSSLAANKNTIDLISLDSVLSEIQDAFFKMALFFCKHPYRNTRIHDVDTAINNGLQHNFQGHEISMSLNKSSQSLNVLTEIDLKILFLYFSYYLYSCLPQTAIASFDNKEKINLILFSQDILDAHMLQIQFNTFCARFFSPSNSIDLLVTDCRVTRDAQSLKQFILSQ